MGLIRNLVLYPFFMSAIGLFQEEVNKLIEKSVRNKTKINASIFKSLKNSLPKFVCDLNLTLVDQDNDYNLIDFSCYVLERFISTFLSHTDARFSIREYDHNTNSMVAVFSTRHDDLPSPIPLNRKNLISHSMKMHKPVIFSRNKKYHYDTKKKLKRKSF